MDALFSFSLMYSYNTFVQSHTCEVENTFCFLWGSISVGASG